MIRMDRGAATRATATSLLMAVLVVGAQAAVVTAATSGTQPMPAVETVPMSPDATAWTDAPSRTVQLSKQQMAYPYGGGSTDKLRVKALTNETHVAFRLRWPDPTRDVSLDQPRNYSDAAALMFGQGSMPPITMGATGTPVNIWYWRAQWQYGDRPSGGDMYVYPHPDNETKPARAAGNPLAKGRYERYAQNYYAKGFGSLTHAPTQNVHARAERTEDGWSVVFVRERQTAGKHDANFAATSKMYVAFAVWNGSADEVNGQKSITLQFSTLDTKSGELSAANAGSQSSGGSSVSDGGGSSGGDGGSSGSGPWLASSPVNFSLSAAALALLTWLVTYWRIQHD